MDKEIVGASTDKVWHALNETGGTSIPELAQKVDLSVESAALAVSWLVRENKAMIECKNGSIEIYNEGHFDFFFG